MVLQVSPIHCGRALYTGVNAGRRESLGPPQKLVITYVKFSLFPYFSRLILSTLKLTDLIRSQRTVTVEQYLGRSGNLNGIFKIISMLWLLVYTQNKCLTNSVLIIKCAK